jgi:hypothetical protein
MNGNFIMIMFTIYITNGLLQQPCQKRIQIKKIMHNINKKLDFSG